jgi:hypothetical protein
MAIKEFLDNSLFTDPRSARDLYGNSVRQALDFNVYGRKTMFQAIVLTRPVFLADVAEGDDSLFGYATRDTGKLTKFSFKGRIIEGPSPHEYLPNPCNARGTTAEEKAKIRRLVTLHTTFISSDDYTKSTNYLPQVGDIVNVRLEENVFSYDLQFGTFVSVKDNRTNVESDESDALDCESLKNAFRNISGASSTRRSSRGISRTGSYQSGAKSNQQAPISDDLIIDIINSTISAGGSKNYNDLFLDSQGDTAVGILHFTKSGLKKLYKEMDTEKYFGKSENEMVDSIKSYSGDEMKDSSWKQGMLSFLNSSESESVQNRAASRKFKEGLVTPKNKGGWNTPREYAVGMFYLNSYPKCLHEMGAKYNWDAEQMLRAYCEGECSAVSPCRSRCNHINKSYPLTASSGGYVYKGC